MKKIKLTKQQKLKLQEILKNEGKIQAIKYVLNESKSGLRESKNYVDGFKNKEHTAKNETFNLLKNMVETLKPTGVFDELLEEINQKK